VIINLVDNAVKFTPEGGRVSVTLKRSGGAAELTVSDTGIGIEPEFLPFIFDRFRQADASTRRSYTGLGLGLAIVRKIVELHGGSITADSAGVEKGSVFTISLPLAYEFYAEEDRTPAVEAEHPGEASLRGARILLVDDDTESLVPLQLFLEHENAEVFQAASAEEALRRLAEQEFHVLISDIGMPVMDGYEFISTVRRLPHEQNSVVPAIALTAYASADDKQRVLSSGFQQHFPKPLDFDELLEAVRELYKRSSS
jgi:CheY-like chemotaxis protein